MIPNCGQLIYRENLTDDLAIFRFRPSDGSKIRDFRPGQFVNLGLKIGTEQIIYRTYSIASSPFENDYYEFYIKHKIHPTLGKFTTELFKMKIGDSIFWNDPRGAFTIDEKKLDNSQETRQMILIASGTGLAPFVSYILYMSKTGTKRKIILLHGVSHPVELGYKKLLEELSSQQHTSLDFTYVPTVSRPNELISEKWNGHIGRVDTLLSGVETHDSNLESILKTKISTENSFFYLCGYKNMVDNVISLLEPLDFVTNRKKRDDGSFDIKYELYGQQ